MLRAEAGAAARALLAVAAGALTAWLLTGVGFVNYDTLFSLVWGDALAGLVRPELGLALAPTPKPLVIAAGVLLAPLGHGAQALVSLGALLSVGALAASAGGLASAFGGRLAGALAAGLVVTREPILSFGVRAYIDVPYAALVVTALASAVRRPDAYGAVVALLGAAGLLRPEAWLLSAAYLAGVVGPRGLRARPWLLVTAAMPPALWSGLDLVLTGDPLWSLTGTRATAALLERPTGLADALLLAPRRIGEIVREPVLIAATGGALIAWRHHGAGGRRLLAAAAVAFLAFCAMAIAGLPALGRYLLLDAVLVVVLAAVGLAYAARAARRDRRWLAFVGAAAVALVAFAPAQAARLQRLGRVIDAQRTMSSDLHRLADAGAMASCGGLSVPNHRLRPMLAAWLRIPPEAIVAGGAPSRGVVVRPATRRVERLFALDPRDPATPAADLPDGYRRSAGNASWTVFSTCRSTE